MNISVSHTWISRVPEVYFQQNSSVQHDTKSSPVVSLHLLDPDLFLLLTSASVFPTSPHLAHFLNPRGTDRLHWKSGQLFWARLGLDMSGM